MEKILLSRKEAANFLNIGVATVDKLSSQGRLPFVKFNWRKLYRKEDLVKFINQHVKGLTDSESLRRKHGK